jgi:hypothetical protein
MEPKNLTAMIVAADALASANAIATDIHIRAHAIEQALRIGDLAGALTLNMENGLALERHQVAMMVASRALGIVKETDEAAFKEANHAAHLAAARKIVASLGKDPDELRAMLDEHTKKCTFPTTCPTEIALREAIDVLMVN